MSSPAPSIYHDHLPVDSDETDYDTYFDGGITLNLWLTHHPPRPAPIDYRYENGRRYHAYHAGSYWAPNDEAAATQEEIFHHVYLMRLNGSLFLAPVDKHEKPKKILDLGTGSGNWCLDMAHAFPETEIIGNDLSPIQPTYVPPNVSFEVDDFNDEWLFPANNFDFVHGRAMYGSVKDWDVLLKRVLRVLKPGGWWENVETTVEILCDDGSVPDDCALMQWVKIMQDACESSGATFRVAGHMREWCEKAGFTEITEQAFKVPIGPWPRDKQDKLVGSFNLANMLQAVEGFSMHLLTRYGNKNPNEVYELIEKVRADMKNKKLHSYFRLFVCYARKPEKEEARPPSRGSTIHPQGPGTAAQSGGETETECGSIAEESEDHDD
ncbi:hypothetical protein Dda_4341 [Drechslerella dactyloides]|uniref:S-adenosyl-L-methionine-dependent methyltransferase n=1 Tax=Drechslerella dactyloides TaxID=74499 RepID=A0AAD6IWQ1_DREDA|nr:hypothetical protein Dda_4341 [Drechslerella dactyloides]